MIRIGSIWSALLVGVAAAASALLWSRIPADAQIAVHWTLEGEVNRFAGKREALCAMPLLMAALSLLFVVIPRIDPRAANLEKSRSVFLVSWIGSLFVLLCVHLVVLWGALTGRVPQSVVLVAAAGLLVLIGNAMAKSRSNWFVGIRTPWSLSDEDAWVAANRTTGWGFVTTGAGSILAAGLGTVASGVLVLAFGAVLSSILGIFVSYIVWRRREAAGGEN